MTPSALEARARIAFALTLRRRWADTLYPALRRDYDAATRERPPTTPFEAATAARTLPLYRWFAWCERGAQKMLWRAAGDAVAALPPVAARPVPIEDTAPELPAWYADWDIHLQPGGLAAPDAGRLYELGAKLVMLGANDGWEFHRLFVRTAVPKRDYRRIVDLGCGFGKSTWPLAEAFAAAEVIGVDLSRPCLERAAERAGELGLPVRLRHASCDSTGLPAASCDLVTATMLVHELPVPVLEATFAEAARLLAPGGQLRILDFQRTGEPFRDLAIEEHGARNNEPFMPPMLAADLAGMAARAGLANVRWVAFDERGAGRLPTLEWPARAEWHFPWAVLEAEKPS